MLLEKTKGIGYNGRCPYSSAAMQRYNVTSAKLAGFGELWRGMANKFVL